MDLIKPRHMASVSSRHICSAPLYQAAIKTARGERCCLLCRFAAAAASASLLAEVSELPCSGPQFVRAHYC